ncbi:MAG TPA: class I SAM-dependent methyltransferase [Gemmatimonadales bacterium]|nr:class I SAM-dependent methyltransferase [Gemmatimonadales bacterium]
MDEDLVPDYGLDAPPVVRNLFLAGVAGLLLWLGSAAGLWSGAVRVPLGGDTLRIVLAPAALSIGITCVGMAMWMVWSSRVGKVRERERLLDTLVWRGDEQVLDVGCGRGLMLVGAARRLRTGRATGIDLWRREDLGGNAPEAALANAAAEGVRDRVTLETADMRALPFSDGSFDVILSQAAVHNVPDAAGRRAALEEMVRVLRPGGTILLADIRHLGEYAGTLRDAGLAAALEGSAIGRTLLGIVTLGALRPGVVRARQQAVG